MLIEAITGIIFFIAVLLSIILGGRDPFAIRVVEQIRYLCLIFFYSPLAATGRIPANPKPVSHFLLYTPGNNTNPVYSGPFWQTGRFGHGEQMSTDFAITIIEHG